MIDLHSHSTASDGTFTPTEVAKKAKEIGLYAMALTDHDVVDGVEEFIAELEESSVIGVTGSELGASYPNTDVEVIALDMKDLAPYKERGLKLIDIRNQANHKRIEILNENGINITWEDVAYDENGVARDLVGKPHLCEVILKKGYADNPEDVYKKLLGRNGIAYVEKLDPPIKETIDFVRQTGAVPILAHPFLTGKKGNELFEFLKELQGYGLLGMEVFHSKQSSELQKEYLGMAAELRLMVSGGSDFHGENHPEMKVGVGIVDENGKGSINIPDIALNPILERRTPANNFYKTIERLVW